MPAPLVPVSLNLQSRGCSCYAPKDNPTSLAPRKSALTRYGSLVAVATIPHNDSRALLAPCNSAGPIWQSRRCGSSHPSQTRKSHRKCSRGRHLLNTQAQCRARATHTNAAVSVFICKRTVGFPHAVPPSPGPSAETVTSTRLHSEHPARHPLAYALNCLRQPHTASMEGAK